MASKNVRQTVKLETITPLQKACVRILRSNADLTDGRGLATTIKDLCAHGCASGMISELIYTRDCVRFYHKHIDQILRTVQDTLDDLFGVGSPVDLFGDKWDGSDMFAREEQNQNLLAWYGFEETVRQMAQEAGMDV